MCSMHHMDQNCEALMSKLFSLSLSWVSWCQNVSILYFIGDDGCGGNNWSYKTYKAPVKPSPPINQHPAFYRVPATEDTKKSRLFKGFYSIIQVLLPVDHSIAYNPTGTREKTHRFEVFMHDVY